ncbi:MAG: Rpn family recombination-promoting nuclease/putative transposase [Thioalkalivibrio sp.]
MTDQDTDRPTDNDSPWKEALEHYFREFTQLLFPAIHDEVDWSRGYSPKDTELQQITADANTGRRYADKLIKVYTRDGDETWVLIHVEVQGEPEEGFAQRMFTYQYRLRDRYGVDVVSLAVLADTRDSFRPTTFHYERWGCELSFTFPAAKLIDWEERWADLEASDNVFALVVRAQIKAKRVKDGATRKDVKIALVRLLYDRGYSREQVVRLFKIIDWMIQLPRELEPVFVQAVYAIQEEKKMPYVNTIERVEREQALQQGMEQGLEKGRHLGVADTLRKQIPLKFGELPDWADERLSQASDEQLDEWAVEIMGVDSLEALLGSH